MRITVHVPDDLGKEMKRIGTNEKRSISSVVTQCIELFINEKKRQQFGNKILELAGKTGVSPDALEQLHSGRSAR